MIQDELILSSLLNRADYANVVYPYLKEEYFDGIYSKIFCVIKEFYDKYATMPTNISLATELSDIITIPKEIEKVDEILKVIFDKSLVSKEPTEWLVNTTEDFCKDKSVYKAISKAIEIYEGKNKDVTRSAIPDIMAEACNISFDSDIGHNWFDDAEERFNFYHDSVNTIKFKIEALNNTTDGNGIDRKSLNLVMAGPNVGKTGFMCSLACDYVMMGYNVLYISLEMAEKLISKRMDANMMNIMLPNIIKLDKEPFLDNITKIRQKTHGQLYIKDYPSGTVHSGHFNHLIEEYKKKKNVIFDVVFVDYIGICASSRVSLSSTNSYYYMKYVAEELRALASIHNIALWSGVQLNRGGFESNDVDLSDTADSFGIPMTADYMITLSRNEQLDKLNQVLCKIVKSRYGSKSRFVLGANQLTQQYYDVEQSALPQIPQNDNPLTKPVKQPKDKPKKVRLKGLN